jgi:hypothetical protein
MKDSKLAIAAALLGVALLLGCHKDYAPDINPDNFVAGVNNPFFPLQAGKVYTYRGVTAQDTEMDYVLIASDTRAVMGVTCMVVLDTVLLNGSLVEKTYDWYAQDKDGSVWYFGEDAKQYENGQVVGTEGSWEGGKNGAQPGIVMEASPAVGDSYRQEYSKDVAEDMAKVLSLTDSSSVPYGTYHNVLRTKDYSPLEPAAIEEKYYARDIGMVLTTTVQGGSDRSELIGITPGR